MKSPVEYLTIAQEQHKGQDPNYGTLGGRIVGMSVAQLAIAQAQDDLHAYYRNLMRAIRYSRPTPTRGLAPHSEEAA